MLSLLQKDFGKEKQAIAYDGIAWITALIRTPLPAWDSSLFFHPCILATILSTKKLYASDFDRPHEDGSLKYFTCGLARGIPKTPQISPLSSMEAFAEKKTSDFSKFIICPEAWL